VQRARVSCIIGRKSGRVKATWFTRGHAAFSRIFAPAKLPAALFCSLPSFAEFCAGGVVCSSCLPDLQPSIPLANTYAPVLEKRRVCALFALLFLPAFSAAQDSICGGEENAVAIFC